MEQPLGELLRGECKRRQNEEQPRRDSAAAPASARKRLCSRRGRYEGVGQLAAPRKPPPPPLTEATPLGVPPLVLLPWMQLTTGAVLLAPPASPGSLNVVPPFWSSSKSAPPWLACPEPTAASFMPLVIARSLVASLPESRDRSLLLAELLQLHEGSPDPLAL